MHVLLQITSLFPLSIPHFSMEGMVILIQMKELIRDTFTMQILNLFKKKLLRKSQKYYKIIPSGQEINTNHPNLFKNCHERKKLRIKCDKVNEVYQAFVPTTGERKCRVHSKLILCFEDFLLQHKLCKGQGLSVLYSDVSVALRPESHM